MFKAILRWILRRLYRIEVIGSEHLEQMGERTMVVANHTSFLDALLFYTFLPVVLTTPLVRPFEYGYFHFAVTDSCPADHRMNNVAGVDNLAADVF